MGILSVSAETWTSELESNGSVDFRPRRERLRCGWPGSRLLMVLSAWTNVEHLRADEMSGTLGVLRLTALAAFVYGTGWTTWQLVTNRPVVTVDAEGISRGRSLQWSGITSIDDPAGWPLDRGGADPTRRIAVRGLLRFRRTTSGTWTPSTPWLRSLHERHRD